MSLSYQEWNDAIAAYFFRTDKAGRPVYLYVTEDLLDELGQPHGGTARDFIASVKVGPPHLWTTHGLCQKALRCKDQWDRGIWPGDPAFPPYVAYLALFALAAGIEGDFAPHAYYPRLRYLLGEGTAPGEYPHFSSMWELWEGLEKWASVDEAGRLGLFTVSIAGSWIHVGIPVAQTVLSEHERASLPAVFARAGLDPLALPADSALAAKVLLYGSDDLRRRTRWLLEEAANPAQRPGEGADVHRGALLLEVLREELRNWDGTAVLPVPAAPSLNSSLGTECRETFGALRICGRLDSVAECAVFRVRCASGGEIPENGYVLHHRQLGQLFCEQEFGGWSTPLVREDGVFLDAAQLEWSLGCEVQDTHSRAKFRLAPATVRVLRDGNQDRLPNLIEVEQLPRGEPFTLLVQDSHAATIEKWGATGCKGFKPLTIRSGLPAGWRVYQAQAAFDDSPVRLDYPALRLPSTIRLRLSGGVKTGHGSEYFAFAPPDIVVEGMDEESTVVCGNTPLRYDSNTRCYHLPPGVLAGGRLDIDVRRANGTRLLRQTLFLADDAPVPATDNLKVFDSFGVPCASAGPGMPGVVGASVMNVAVPAFDFEQARAIPQRTVVEVGEEDLQRLLREMHYKSKKPLTIDEMCNIIQAKEHAPVARSKARG